MATTSPLDLVFHLRRDLATARRAACWRRRVLGTGLVVVAAAAALVACDPDRPPAPGRAGEFAADVPATGTASTSGPADTSADTPTTFGDPAPIPDDDLGEGGAVKLDPVGADPTGSSSDPWREREPGTAFLVSPN